MGNSQAPLGARGGVSRTGQVDNPFLRGASRRSQRRWARREVCLAEEPVPVDVQLDLRELVEQLKQTHAARDAYFAAMERAARPFWHAPRAVLVVIGNF